MKERARSFRRSMTNAENRLWYYLRNRRLNGYKFVREFVIGNYIADFVCRQKRLVVEVDGSQHMERAAYDKKRTIELERSGYQVMRVWNNEVFNNIEGVLEAILNILEHVPNHKPSSPTLLSEGEGRQTHKPSSPTLLPEEEGRQTQKPSLSTANLKSNAGFSIAEVLLSIAITILLIDLIIHACITLVNQHNLLKEKTTLAENAQFAEFILRREIQTAGFFGCNTFNQLDIHYHLKKHYLPIIPLQIFSKVNYSPSFSPPLRLPRNDGENDEQAVTYKNSFMPDDIHAESDVIVIEKMSEKTVDFLSQKKSMAIKASKENPFEANEPIVIADCQQADIFLPSSITYGNSFQTIKTKKALQHHYDNGLLGKLVATAFFVGETHRKNAYGKAIHALYSYDLINRRKTEWVSGVDAMEVFYAEQNSDDHDINFNPASTMIDSSSIRLIKIVLSLSNEDFLFSKKESLHTKKEILIFLRELA